MKNALRICRVARIDIYFHWTFGLLLAGILALYLVRGATVVATAMGLTLVAALFACVVLHELGHALTARRFGIATRDITLYPIGGVARLERIPENPTHEFWIAIAGPAVNLGIAAVLFLAVLSTGRSMTLQQLVDPGSDLLGALLWLNILLVGFNMLPAFPMDGGRVLRAILASKMAYLRATKIAANVGQGMAILFGLVGVVSFNPILLFIALFVYIGAQQEAQFAQMRSVSQGLAVSNAMMTRFRALGTTDTLDDAIRELLAGADQDFPIVNGGVVVGILTRKRMMSALATLGREASVGEVMEPVKLTLEHSVMLDEAFQRMQSAGTFTVPVLRNGRLAGMLTLENIGELMMISSALRTPGGAGRRESDTEGQRQAVVTTMRGDMDDAR